jgi:hypothetical protein
VAYDETDELVGEDYAEVVSVDVVDASYDATLFDSTDEGFDYYDDGLQPPSSISVVSQSVRVGTAGTQTVDIVVEIADVSGAAEYERRDAV